MLHKLSIYCLQFTCYKLCRRLWNVWKLNFLGRRLPCNYSTCQSTLYLDSSYTRSPGTRRAKTPKISTNVVNKLTRFCSSATTAVRAYKLLITAQFRKAVWYYRTGPTLVHVVLGLHLCPTAPTANPIPPGLQQNGAIYWRRVPDVVLHGAQGRQN